VATARLLEGVRGDRLLVPTRLRTAAGDEYVQEVSLEPLEALGPSAVSSAFDREARAAFALAEVRGYELDEHSGLGTIRGLGRRFWEELSILGALMCARSTTATPLSEGRLRQLLL
jgi:hypothetical protein